VKTWDAVKEIIKVSNLTYYQVSNRLNKSKNYISASMAAYQSPSVKTLATICHALGWHVELVRDDGGASITIE
jgi:transcriptional regulator with XRE-family HTH domain